MSKYLIVWDTFKEVVSLVLIIHLTAVGVDAVAHDEVVDMEQQIIDRNLIENLLRDGHRWGFVFHDHAWLESGGVQDAVGTHPFVAHLKADLVGHQGGGVAELLGQHVDKVLPHPLLWRERNVLLAQYVEYLALAVGLPHLYLVGRQV